MPHLLCTVATISLLAAVGVSAADDCVTRIDPLPICASCPVEEDLRAPGVGFALETGYGAAAVRLHDGPYHPVALIEGDAAYTTLLRNFATGPEDREPDPNDPSWSRWEYAKRRAMRRVNKLLGRPATPETAILAAMVSDLVDATRSWLGDSHAVTAAVLSSPHRVRLTDEETNDIFDYLKLRNLMSEPDNLDALYATSAAYAGYEHGLCANYTAVHACEREECHWSYRRVLHIDFNRESLSGTIDVLQSYRSWGARSKFVDFDLGYLREETQLDMAATSDDESSEDGSSFYWDMVSARIRDFASSYHPRVDRILLTGPSATHPRFKHALRAALYDLVDADVLSVLESGEDEEARRSDEGAWQTQVEFATAKGAAEVAKRRQEGPVRCRWSEECKARRERTAFGVREKSSVRADDTSSSWHEDI